MEKINGFRAGVSGVWLSDKAIGFVIRALSAELWTNSFLTEKRMVKNLFSILTFHRKEIEKIECFSCGFKLE